MAEKDVRRGVEGFTDKKAEEIRRINEFHDDDKFYSINFEPRNSAGTGVEETLTIIPAQKI